MDKMADKVREIASRLGTNAQWLDALINFETAGTYSPSIKNPNSSARGLIQVIDSTARGEFGERDSLALVSKFDTFASQMDSVVYPYLAKYKPFPTKQSLYMAIFYPKYRFVDPSTPFPASVQRANTYDTAQGSVTIHTPAEYIAFVDKRIRKDTLLIPVVPIAGIALLAIAGAGVYLYMRK